MGWLSMPLSSMHPYTRPKDYLDAQFTYTVTLTADGERVKDDEPVPQGAVRKSLRVLASSALRNRVYYAAVLPGTDGIDEPAFAIVCLIKWNPRAADGYVFAYKDMDESMGPYEAECPPRILDLLGPTENPGALAWRARCRARGLNRRKLTDGMHICFAEPVRFTDGYEGREFFVRKVGRRTGLALTRDGPMRYRYARLAEATWELVSRTRVHATVFG